jgi:exodeoxyribonuclease VII large subunit
VKSVYSVSQINSYIKNMFRQDYMLQSVLVRGEVSNCKYHSSGHIYFTLKDGDGTLNCVMFAGSRRGLTFPMKEGDEVICAGSVDVYEKAGSYQLYAKQIIRDGAGLLNEKFEQLKKRLEEQGMFDERYKQPIPKYIRTLGVVTAPTGAAVHDIMSISLRRDPYLRIILYPAIVQGEEAPASIINGIRALDSLPEEDRPDVIIIGRGGGSIEDLWAFNEEAVAQAVFDCAVPVISAVGHETDTVITDYVADLRAPTPSAAAELAVFEYDRFLEELGTYENDLRDAVLERMENMRSRVQSCEREMRHLSPSAKIREKRMFSAQAADQLQMCMRAKLQEAKQQAERYSAAQLGMLMQNRIDRRRHRLELFSATLDAASPLKKLSGGYGYVTGPDGSPLKDVSGVQKGDRITVRLKDGRIEAETKEIYGQES